MLLIVFVVVASGAVDVIGILACRSVASVDVDVAAADGINDMDVRLLLVVLL